MTGFLYFIIDSLLSLLIFAIIVSAVLSWLVAFNVINIRHPVARQLVHFLDAVTRPVLWPFRRIIPPLGGVDITPLIALIVIQGIKGYLLPWIFGYLAQLTGG
jgi:YggT family protein